MKFLILCFVLLSVTPMTFVTDNENKGKVLLDRIHEISDTSHKEAFLELQRNAEYFREGSADFRKEYSYLYIELLDSLTDVQSFGKGRAIMYKTDIKYTEVDSALIEDVFKVIVSGNKLKGNAYKHLSIKLNPLLGYEDTTGVRGDRKRSDLYVEKAWDYNAIEILTFGKSSAHTGSDKTTGPTGIMTAVRRSILLSIIVSVIVILLLILLRYRNRLKHKNEEIQKAENLLKRREQQNCDLMKMVLKDNMKCTNSGIITKFKQAAIGQEEPTEENWLELYHTIEEKYPTFKDAIHKKLPQINETTLRVCYLLKAGMSNPEIERITNAPRQTVWNRVKRIKAIMGDEIRI